jgi:glucose/arabinose dehydrogenase
MLVSRTVIACFFVVTFSACGSSAKLSVADGMGPKPQLPSPKESIIPTVHIATAVGWPNGVKPQVAEGLAVNLYADNLQHPRWLYALPNGDVLVAESNAPAKPKKEMGFRSWITSKFMAKAGAGAISANRIILLRDLNKDGVVDEQQVFLQDLNSPIGMALIGDDLYVANTDAVIRYQYVIGQTKITDKGTKVLDLPAGLINYHWTKNMIASQDGSKLYITVGSNSNIGEKGMDNEIGRAAIWELDIPSGKHRIFASGLRNPNGMSWEPLTNSLWVVVNERDEIGSDLVPDYLTSVKDGGFYGWPYSYYGQHIDQRVQPQKPELVARAILPDYALGPHTASLGLAYSNENNLTEAFRHGMFIGQHGSWNRKPFSGYKVIFVPFKESEPSGLPLDVLTGFLNDKDEAQGRPVGVLIDHDGGLLVADDVGNKIWRVTQLPEQASNH